LCKQFAVACGLKDRQRDGSGEQRLPDYNKGWIPPLLLASNGQAAPDYGFSKIGGTNLAIAKAHGRSDIVSSVVFGRFSQAVWLETTILSRPCSRLVPSAYHFRFVASCEICL
jgi:hypothetical protein